METLGRAVGLEELRPAVPTRLLPWGVATLYSVMRPASDCCILGGGLEWEGVLCHGSAPFAEGLQLLVPPVASSRIE